MTQLTQLQIQGKTQPFSRIIVPQPVKGMPSALLVQVPVNVAFVTKVKIQTGDADQGIEVPFTRCVPDGASRNFRLGLRAWPNYVQPAREGKALVRGFNGKSDRDPIVF